jgi:oxygen-independent coproporphyrinogen III oxidase
VEQEALVKSLYIHFPYCRTLCNYCDFYKSEIGNISTFNNYHNYLEESLAKHHKFFLEHNIKFGKLETLYIGGGTPSLWGEEGSLYLSNLLNEHSISLNKNVEFTLEVNPGTWTKASLDSWENSGVNRFSVGMQSLDTQIFKFLDRLHSVDDSIKTMEELRNRKANYSVDIMIGLPFSEQNNRNLIAEIEQALTYNPSHISLYILTIGKGYKHYKHLPSEEYIENEYLIASEFLRSKGFLHYEVSNFAKKDKESKHNLNYWKSESVAALGPSATGLIKKGKLGIRYKWRSSLVPDYSVEQLSKKEMELENIYLQLRTNIGITLEMFSNNLSRSHWEKLTLKWINSKVIVEQAKKYYLTPKGYLILDSIMSDIFTYYK